MNLNLWMLGILDSYHDFEKYFTKKEELKKIFSLFKKYYCSLIEYSDDIKLMKTFRNYFTVKY